MEISRESKALFIVRHGERTDKELEDSPIFKGDPNLSTTGIKQAELTGAYLSQLLGCLGSKKIRIISSPLIRTIQTAYELAKKLNITEIELDNRFIEKMNPGTMTVEPWDLEVRRKSPLYIRDTYLRSNPLNNIVRLVDNNQDYAHLDLRRGESKIEAKKRVRDFIQEMITTELRELDYDATIIVGHKFTADAFSNNYCAFTNKF